MTWQELAERLGQGKFEAETALLHLLFAMESNHPRLLESAKEEAWAVINEKVGKP